MSTSGNCTAVGPTIIVPLQRFAVLIHGQYDAVRQSSHWRPRATPSLLSWPIRPQLPAGSGLRTGRRSRWDARWSNSRDARRAVRFSLRYAGRTAVPQSRRHPATTACNSQLCYRNSCSHQQSKLTHCPVASRGKQSQVPPQPPGPRNRAFTAALDVVQKRICMIWTNARLLLNVALDGEERRRISTSRQPTTTKWRAGSRPLAATSGYRFT